MEKLKQTKSDIALAWKSFTQFVEASALLGLTVYALYNAYHREKDLVFALLVFAGVVVGLRGAHEYWKHFTRKG